MATSFTPVSYDYREAFQEEIAKCSTGKVFFFDDNNKLDCIEGQIATLEEINGKGWFIALHPHHSIRIDRIITFFGRPGPAFDEYDAYANACLDCTGGYDLD